MRIRFKKPRGYFGQATGVIKDSRVLWNRKSHHVLYWVETLTGALWVSSTEVEKVNEYG